ncbi:MAG: AAA family ATPase [Patescibacteria group bacterium]|nr:AAA family ATPase [Patescibacteria group bacterium]
MYLEVIPLIEKNGQLKLGGQGKIIDYVLKMKEIPQKYLMDRRVKKGEINKKIIDQLAKIVAKFHQKAKTSKKISYFGSLKIIQKNWQENFSQTRSFIGRTVSQKDFYFIKKSVEEFIKKNKKLFQQRIGEKKIRDCHGDLHTRNIFVTPKKIYIFDCIEFNDRFRYQDVVNEIAFLAMDLDFLNRKDLSDYFVKKYIESSHEKNLTKLLLFYKCYRAYVCGKVLSFRLGERNLSWWRKLFYQKISQRYFRLARKYVQEWQKPILILGAGLPGIGRSTRLKLLAKKIKAKILDSDLIRRQIFQKPKYDFKSKLLVYQKMMRKAEKFLKQGKKVILDATFSLKIYRQLAIDLVRKLKISYFVIEFYCPKKVAKKRLEKRDREKSISEANWQVYQKIKKEFEPIQEKENYLKINTALPLEESVNRIIQYF